MGKISDKFLSMLRLDPDDDYDDEDYFDEPDEEEEPIYTKRSTSRSKKFIDEEEDMMSGRETARENVRTVSSPSRTAPASSVRSKVVPMRGKGRNVSSNMEVCVIRPTNMNDCPDVTDTLLSGRAVILNLEGLQTDTAQRIIDFTSGSCYAINGNLQKITSYIFIITPESVEISGDFQEMLGSGVDVTGKTSAF